MANKILNSYGQLGDIIIFFFTYVAFGESKAVRQYLQCKYFKTINELSESSHQLQIYGYSLMCK